MKFYKCEICGKIIATNDLNDAVCHEKEMVELIPNTIDAAVEKHVPICEVINDKIKVTVGKVEHPMSEEHYIMFIAKVNNTNIQFNYLEPGSKPTCFFDYEENVKIYAYCNLHGLWVSELN